MKLQAATFDEFYASAAGMTVRRCIGRRLARIRPSFEGKRLLGFGYAEPYLAHASAATDAIVFCRPPALAPLAGVGQTAPASAIMKSAPAIMKDDFVLPFADGTFDAVLAVHGFEIAMSARQLLRQVWRILVPQGRLILVVANRPQGWGASQTTPFAFGRSYRRAELDGLLREALFECQAWDSALYCSPRMLLRCESAGETGRRVCLCVGEALGRMFFAGHAGVHIVVAQKTLCTTPLRVETEAMSGVFAQA